jgi:HK97 gp10 family phage protein
MSLVKAYSRAQFTTTGAFFVGVRSRLVAAAERAQEIAFQEAKNLVPVDTGALQASIQKDQVTDDGEIVTATVSATMPYAGYVEFGTGKRGAESAGADLRHTYKMDWPGMVAQPYLRPALDTARAQVLLEFTR